jgi:hypothetical protein
MCGFGSAKSASQGGANFQLKSGEEAQASHPNHPPSRVQSHALRGYHDMWKLAPSIPSTMVTAYLSLRLHGVPANQAPLPGPGGMQPLASG